MVVILLPGEAGAGGYIGLDADNRFDLALALLIEIEGPVHVSMVCQSYSGHAQLLDSGDQGREADHTVQKGVFAVKMKVNKVYHRTSGCDLL